MRNPLFCGDFHLSFGAKLQWGKNHDTKKMAASIFYFYTEIGRSIRTICQLCCIILYTNVQKWEKNTVFSQVLKIS